MRNLIVKDFIRQWRSPVATLTMLFFPIVMSLMIGAISSGGSSGPEFPTIRVLLVDEDEDLLGALLGNMSGDSDMSESLDLDVVDLAEGTRIMEKGDASAMLVLPEGATDALIAGEEVTLRLVRNPAEGIKPEIVEQGVLIIATVLDLAVKVFGEELQEIRDMALAEDWPEVAQVTTLAGKVFERLSQLDKFVFPPSVKVETVNEESESQGPGFNVFGYILVMISAMAIFFVASRATMDFFEEQKTGMLRRVLSSPTKVSTLVDAKLVFGVLYSILAMVILLVFAFTMGWLARPVDLVGVALHTAAFAVAACGVMTLVLAFCHTEKQAGILSWIVIMVMSVLGGSMFPTANMPEAMQGVARFTLNYWAIEGFLDLLVHKRAFADMMGRTLVLAGLGVFTLTVGKIALVRRYREVAP